MWARIQDDAVAEIISFDPTGKFHPSLTWEPCDASVELGYTWDGSAFHAPAGPALAEAQTTQIAALAAACQAEIYRGFASSALGATYTYPANDTDQRNLIASVTASLLPNLPTTWAVPFWCADSSGNWATRPHTAAQIQKAGSDGQAAITALRLQNAKLAAEVMAAATVAAVQAVTWTMPA